AGRFSGLGRLLLVPGAAGPGHAGPQSDRELHGLEGQTAYDGSGRTDGRAVAARDRPFGRHSRARSPERGGPVRISRGMGEGAPAGGTVRLTQAPGGVTESTRG